MAGYISLSMPLVLQYIAYLSPTTWGAYILTNVAFQGETFTCDASEEDSAGNCPYSTGQQVLELYDMDGGSGEYGMYFHMYMLAAVTIALLLISYCAMRGRAYSISH